MELRSARRSAFWRGVRVAFGVPGALLFSTSIGFGAISVDAGLTLGHAMFVAAMFYAIPAQVVFVDEMARGGSLLVICLAVSATAIRLLPMTVSLVPYFRDDPGRFWLKLVAVHTTAITPWLEAQRLLPIEPPQTRLPLYLGIGQAILCLTLAGAALGHLLAGSLPPLFAVALVFLTPLYFLLSLIGLSTNAGMMSAVILGAVLGPTFHWLGPDSGVDLLLSGLVGGTLAWAISFVRRDRSAGSSSKERQQ